MRYLTAFSVWIALVGFTLAQPPMITNVSYQAGSVLLQWDTPTNKFIVERFDSLVDWYNEVSCVGSSTGQTINAIECPIEGDSAFFRLRLGLSAVEFVDAGLEDVIRQAISDKRIPTNRVYDTELSGITYLNGDNKGISDLSGLQNMHDLTQLNLRGNSITSLAPLTHLTDLTWLMLENNQISDVSALGGLTKLTRLGLHYNQLVDISPLSNLVNLTWLALNNNDIVDATQLNGLSALQTLYLSSNPITNLNGVSGWTSLQELHLHYCPLNDLTGISSMSSLRELYLEEHDVADISFASGLANLRRLYLIDGPIVDVGAVSNLTLLTDLILRGNSITNIPSLLQNAAQSGLGAGDYVDLRLNPLGSYTLTNEIPLLESYGVTVEY